MNTLYQGFHRFVNDRGYEFVDEGDCVAVLPMYRDTDGRLRYVVRREVCPTYQSKRPDLPEDSKFWTLVGGRIDPGEHAFNAMKRELLEETGIALGTFDVIIEYPRVPLCKSSNVRITFYVILMNEFEMHAPLGDGSHWEAASETVHISESDLREVFASRVYGGAEDYDFMLLSLFSMSVSYNL